MTRAMSSASTMPNATHNSIAPPLEDSAPAEETGVTSGDSPNRGTGRGEYPPLSHVPRNHSQVTTVSTTTSANANHKRSRSLVEILIP